MLMEKCSQMTNLQLHNQFPPAIPYCLHLMMLHHIPLIHWTLSRLLYPISLAIFPPASLGQPYYPHERFSPVPHKTSLVRFGGSSFLSCVSYDHTVHLDPDGEVILDPDGEVTVKLLLTVSSSRPSAFFITGCSGVGEMTMMRPRHRGLLLGIDILNRQSSQRKGIMIFWPDFTYVDLIV